MKATPLVSVQFWRVSVPYLLEWVCSPEYGTHADTDRLILKMTDSDGNTGWGEGPWRSSLEDAQSALGHLIGKAPADLRPSFLDVLWTPGTLYWHHPLPPSPLSPRIETIRHRLRHPMQTAVETGLIDLLTRRAGLPFSSYFGGSWRDKIATDYWVGRATIEHAANCAKRALELGFKGMKLKTTLEDPNIERLEAIKEIGGDGFKITVDPNGRFYRFDDAWATLKAMDEIGNLNIIEDAFPRTAIAETRELRNRMKARVVVHIDPPESLGQTISERCCGGLNIDSHSQGLFHWRMQANTADQFNLPVWHGSGLDLGIYTAAQLHLAASAPNCELSGDQSGPWLRAASLIKEPFDVQDGYVRVPFGTGLGVTPDLDAIEQYTINSSIVK